MKIIGSIDRLYDEQFEINTKLKLKADKIIQTLKKENWHYISRLKGRESFALKIETGRFNDPRQLEDFFACTLVVENYSQIDVAESYLKKHFEIIDKRPPNSGFTHKDPYSFQFDDIRLYAKLKEEPTLPVTDLHHRHFEIQLKTFLQHAWGIATHDLIYKSNDINWSKERIAFQIKAMLEQAELTISGVNTLMNLPEVTKDNKNTSQLKKILKIYQSHFDVNALPNDLVRLCQITKDFLRTINVKVSDLNTILQKEYDKGYGSNLTNLSPFLIVVKSIYNQSPQTILDYAMDSNARFKLILPDELNIEIKELDNSQNIIII